MKLDNKYNGLLWGIPGFLSIGLLGGPIPLVSPERFPIEIEESSGGGKGYPTWPLLVRKSIT